VRPSEWETFHEREKWHLFLTVRRVIYPKHGQSNFLFFQRIVNELSVLISILFVKNGY